jgi:peroxiredoxin
MLRRRLEVAVNICVLAVAALAANALVQNYWLARGNQPRGDSFAKGSLLPVVPSIEYSKSPRTIILFLNTKCTYCTGSAPYYEELGKHQADTGTPIIAVFSESGKDVREYMEKHGLSIKAVSGVDFRAFKVPLIPSMVLIDSDGRILDSWVGQLTPASEKDVLEALK